MLSAVTITVTIAVTVAAVGAAMALRAVAAVAGVRAASVTMPTVLVTIFEWLVSLTCLGGASLASLTFRLPVVGHHRQAVRTTRCG